MVYYTHRQVVFDSLMGLFAFKADRLRLELGGNNNENS